MECASRSDLHQNGSGRTCADGEMTTMNKNKKNNKKKKNGDRRYAVILRCLNAISTKRGRGLSWFSYIGRDWPPWVQPRRLSGRCNVLIMC